MEILGFEKVSLVDYEGFMCATIFTGGCNFCCPFCHNSGLVKHESMAVKEEDVLDYLKKRKGLLEAVTISGGEPTLQKDLIDFVEKIKNLGYRVKLDTNGTNPQVLKTLLDKNLLDYVAMDIKNNFEDYAHIAGVKRVPLDNIKESLSLLKASKIDYELRTTLVSEFHTEENIKKLAEDLKGQKTLYLQKFVDSGACIEDGLNEIKKETALKFKEILSKNIKNVILRGY